jgi:hypothetical protein
MRSDGSTWKEIGARFIVSARAARNAVLGDTWKHVRTEGAK